MDNKQLHNIQDKLENVKIVMNENIQFALQNTDKIDNIEQKSELLEESSNSFKEKAYKLKQTMCSKYWKRNVTISVIILIFIIIIIIITS